MSVPFKLYRLQQIDSQLNQARNKLQQILKQLADDHEIKNARDALDLARSAFFKSQQDMHIAEEEVKAQKIKIEQSEASLYSGKIHNPKELQDLDKDLKSLRKYLSILEDRLLEKMIFFEEQETLHSRAKNRFDELSDQNLQRSEQLGENKNLVEVEIDRLEKERLAASESIPAEKLNLYNQLLGNKQGHAVARVIETTCEACGSTLSVSILQSANALNQVTFCNTCGRILYGGK